jgi:hypothetical protein
MGSAALGSNRDRLQLCGSPGRPSRGIMEILATRLDTGESDYCRLRFSLPPWLDVSPASLGSTAATLEVGQSAVAVIPGETALLAFLPGQTLRIGGNRLVVRGYDAGSRTLRFYTGATVPAAAGMAIAGQGDLKVVENFASADILHPPALNGAAIELRTSLYADGAPAPTPIAVTFWSTDTLYFDGPQPPVA